MTRVQPALRPSMSATSIWGGAGTLLLFGFFLLTHGYGGIRHDGILYLAQALFRNNAEVFGGDIFFKYGSQDSFTVFSYFHAKLIALMGLQQVNLLLIVIFQVGFFGVVCWWAKHLAPQVWRLLSLFAVCIVPSLYGGAQVFAYAEPFVTARPLAEIATLVALACLCSGHRSLAVVFGFLALLIHPLIALPGWLAGWLWLCLGNRRWWWLALAALPVGLAAVAGIRPFDQILRFHDAEWRNMLEEGRHLFVSLWSWPDWATIALDAAVLFWAARATDDPAIRRCLFATLAALLLGIGASLVGVDLLSNVLITSLQLWRTQWIAHLFGVLASPILFKAFWQQGNLGRVTALLLAYALLARGLPTGALAAGLLIVLVAARRYQRKDLKAYWPIVIAVLLVGAQLVMWQNNFRWEVKIVETLSSTQMPLMDVAKIAVSKMPVGPLLLFLPLLFIWWKWGQRSLSLQLLLVVAALGLAWGGWDQRSPWTKTLESYPIGSHPFTKFVPPTAEVYWWRDPLAPWLLMERRSYYSGAQGAGQVFNRETAVELAQRRKVMGVFELQEVICGLMNKLNEDPNSCEPDIESMRGACELDSNLSFLVSHYNLGNAWISSWQPEVGGRAYGKPYYLFSCQKLLAADSSLDKSAKKDTK